MDNIIQNLLDSIFGTPKSVQPNQANDAFMKQWQANKQANPDKVADNAYGNYLQGLKLPKKVSPQSNQNPVISNAIYAARKYIPYLDSPKGHQDLQESLASYPFTPQARKFLNAKAVFRDSSDPKVIEEEADTEKEKVLGFETRRDRTDIGSYTKYSPEMSVTTHELMHTYLDQKGYPYGEDSFNKDWEAAKKKNPILQTIDTFIANSSDYTDEQNKTDISQERYAYLAQELSGAGLKAFPKSLQRHYAPIFK